MGKKIGKIVVCVAGAALVVVLGYVGYMLAQYYRIEDHTVLEVVNNQSNVIEPGTPYTLMTYNIGFGAYSDDYTFFMDVGEMKDGTATRGTSARAFSEDAVRENVGGSIRLMQEADCDFYFLQEVDVKATRSYHVNQKELVLAAFPGHASVFANNFHSAYLFYPFTEPHGAVESGMLTLSQYAVAESVRRQFPVTDALITKFTDLDRCFSMTRFVVGEKELVLIQLHMSAYDEGGRIRAEQLRVLNEVLKEEYDKGNYVIAGGDFNHDIAGTIAAFPSEQSQPSWIFELDNDSLADGFSFVRAENADEAATCRGADIPYEKGVTYVATVDGFLVSDNVEAAAINIDNEFRYSDHNPVVLTFVLKSEE